MSGTEHKPCLRGGKIFLALILILSLSACKEDQKTGLFITVDEVIPVDKKIPALLEEVDNTGQRTLPIRIERRGGFSLSFDKHSYEIDLQEDLPFLGLPADDDFILNASYIDKTFLRHGLSFDLFTAMDSSYEAPEWTYSPVYLNGQYQGLYLVMEKMDKSSLDVSSKGGFIFKEPHLFRESYDGLPEPRPGNFHHQTYPKMKEKDNRPTLEALRSLILDSSDHAFDEQLPKLMDINNLVDWHLLLLITNNSDGCLKNFFLYRVDSLSPIRLAPWDFDHSFGRDGDNELNMNERQLDITRSILYRRLLTRPWYQLRLKERWAAHVDARILSLEGLKARIRTMADKVRPYVHTNARRWPMDGPWYHDDKDFEEEIQIMMDYLDLRMEELAISN
jgi:hypothetical protein